jgi:hypothetical protein
MAGHVEGRISVSEGQQTSYWYGLPGIKREPREGELVTIVDMRLLPPHCQFELIKEALSLLESGRIVEEEQAKLVEALRTYLTTTKKPINVKSSRIIGTRVGLLTGVISWIYALFLLGGYIAIPSASFSTGVSILIALGAGLSFCVPVAIFALLGSVIGFGLANWWNNRHMHTLKSKTVLKNLIREIKLSLDQAASHETEELTSSITHDKPGCSTTPVFVPPEKESDSLAPLEEGAGYRPRLAS